MQRKCKRKDCRKVFTPSQVNQFYCCPEHRTYHAKSHLETVVCANSDCNELFVQKSWKHRYCYKCKEKKNRKEEVVWCEGPNCDQPISKKHGTSKRFCSSKCRKERWLADHPDYRYKVMNIKGEKKCTEKMIPSTTSTIKPESISG
jgi:hypothetical protein